MENQNLLYIDVERFKEEYMTGVNGTMFYDYICYFVRCDLLDCRIEPDYAYINFKNDQVRMCLTKAGLILELKTYLICKKLMDSRGGDCLTSVTIDWDGDENLASTIKYLYDADDPDSTIDTTNEMDVLATCGLLPYFISCKNGRFTVTANHPQPIKQTMPRFFNPGIVYVYQLLYITVPHCKSFCNIPAEPYSMALQI